MAEGPPITSTLNESRGRLRFAERGDLFAATYAVAAHSVVQLVLSRAQ